MLNTNHGCRNTWLMTKSHRDLLEKLTFERAAELWHVTKRFHDKIAYNPEIELSEEERLDLGDLRWLSEQFYLIQFDLGLYQGGITKVNR